MDNATPSTVNLSSQVDRSLIPVDRAGERYVLLTIQAPTPPRQIDRLPLNVSLIIDRSGSMSGANKLEYVKEAAIHALRLLTDRDRTSLVIYDDKVELLGPSQPVTAQARYDLIKRIRQIRTGGMTNLSGGWFTGCDQIADYMSGDHINRALLLTDGLANVGLTDQELLVHEAKELYRRGISTTTFGVGRDFNQFLLHGIADAGGGHFYFIDSPSQIPNYFKGELGEMLHTVAREMALDIDVPPDVEINLLNDTPFERTGIQRRLFLGDAYAGEQRTLVAKLTLPARRRGQDVSLALTLRYADAQQRRPVTVESPAVRFTVAEPHICDSQPVNDQVMNEAARLETEQAKMAALRSEYSGDIAGAKTTLHGMKSRLAAMPASLARAFAAEIETLDDEMTSGLTEVARKESHYKTYRSQHSRKDYKD